MTLCLLTPDDAAAILRVPVRTVVQLCAQGRIPGAAKVGRRWRIPEAGLGRMFPDAGLSGLLRQNRTRTVPGGRRDAPSHPS